MSIPDELMWDWLLLLTAIEPTELEARKQAAENGELHPKAVKQELARILTARFQGEDAAAEAAREFDEVFVGGGVPDEIPQHTVDGGSPLSKLLAAVDLVASNGEARRLVQQGAVSIDGDRADDPFLELPARAESYLIKVGKRRFARVTVQAG
jgi:tyrosyl-tRNA synthetase